MVRFLILMSPSVVLCGATDQLVNMFDAKKNYLGTVVQSIVILTTSLRLQPVKYMPTTLSNPLLFFVEKM